MKDLLFPPSQLVGLICLTSLMKKFYVNIDKMKEGIWIDFAQFEYNPMKNSVGAGLDSSSSVFFFDSTLNTINSLDDEDYVHDTVFNIYFILLWSVL